MLLIATVRVVRLLSVRIGRRLAVWLLTVRVRWWLTVGLLTVGLLTVRLLTIRLLSVWWLSIRVRRWLRCLLLSMIYTIHTG